MDVQDKLDSLSPLPWRDAQQLEGGHMIILDAAGNEVAAIWNAEDAAFIMEAPALLEMLCRENRRLRRQLSERRGGHFHRELGGRPHP